MCKGQTPVDSWIRKLGTDAWPGGGGGRPIPGPPHRALFLALHDQKCRFNLFNLKCRFKPTPGGSFSHFATTPSFSCTSSRRRGRQSPRTPLRDCQLR